MSGDLARRRSARDLWISRSHVWAAGAVVVLSLAASFGAGYLVGQEEPAPAERVAYTDAAEGEELVEVLARVDANVHIDGGVGELTFPHALTAPVEGDPAPPGRYTVEVGRFGAIDTARPLRDHLRAAGLSAWLGVERVDGTSTYRVSVGGYPAEAAASAALAAINEAVVSYPGTVGIPHVRDQQPVPAQ